MSAPAQTAPVVQAMARDINFLSNLDSVAVRQTRKGCLQEILGCEAQTEVDLLVYLFMENDLFISF